jgi:hypothetical protein
MSTRAIQHYVHEISQKVISFAIDAPAAYRSNAGAESLSALVLDPPTPSLTGFASSAPAR